MKGEKRAHADPEYLEQVRSTLAQPNFIFEICEHIAACFSCVARTLDPGEQAALMLREVLGFTAQEAARILGVSEPVFRHRLSDARAAIIRSFDGLCQLINKQGACWQCRGLREFAPQANRGADLVQIEVQPGVALTPEALFDARLAIVRTVDLEDGKTRPLHDLFFDTLTQQEERNLPAKP